MATVMHVSLLLGTLLLKCLTSRFIQLYFFPIFFQHKVKCVLNNEHSLLAIWWVVFPLQMTFADERTLARRKLETKKSMPLCSEVPDIQKIKRTNRTKRAHFRGRPLFQATYNIKTEKKQRLIQVILCQADAGGWRKEKGTRRYKRKMKN